jgi:cell division protease FtsH
MFTKLNNNGLTTREVLFEHLMILLAGRVAEEVIFGLSVSSGALSDLESAFNLAKLMVMQYGMGNKIIYPYFSEQYKKEIDDEIHLLINRAYKDSKKTLEENRLLLVQLADTLIVKKVMMYEEIVDFMKSFNSR